MVMHASKESEVDDDVSKRKNCSLEVVQLTGPFRGILTSVCEVQIIFFGKKKHPLLEHGTQKIRSLRSP